MTYFIEPIETNNDLNKGLILINAAFDAAPERIYHSLTDPKEFEIWWGSDDTYHMTNWLQDLRDGGSYTVDVLNNNGRVAPASGHFIEIYPPDKFVYTRKYEWEFPGLGRQETTISYLVFEAQQGSQLQIIHEGFEGQREAALEHSGGWKRVLNWLGEYLDLNNLKDYYTSIKTEQKPREVFQAVCNITGWWASHIEGESKHLGDLFTVHFGTTWATIRVTEWTTDRRIIWTVIDCHMDLLKDKSEWKGTKIIWNISIKDGRTVLQMTHLGLIPSKECFVDCTGGWNFYIKESISNLLNRNVGLPGIGIMATIVCQDRIYKGVLYSKDQQLKEFPEGYLLIDVMNNDVEKVTKAYSVNVMNPVSFNQLKGKYYMVVEDKPVSKGIQPMLDLQYLLEYSPVE